MALIDPLDLPVVDGLTLPGPVRALLRPGEAIRDYEAALRADPNFVEAREALRRLRDK